MDHISTHEGDAAPSLEPLDRRAIRLQRYHLARRLAHGRQVLDLHGGDGSGAAIVAQTAVMVAATLPEAAAVTRAQASFPAAHLSFHTNATTTPYEWDLVLSFGGLDRAGDPQAVFASMAAALRPGGIALIGVANRAHAAAPEGGRFGLTAEELQALAQRHFRTASVHLQCGIVAAALTPAADGSRLRLEGRGLLHGEAHERLPQATDLLCVASDGRIDDLLPDSLLIADTLEPAARQQERLQAAEQELARLRAERASLTAGARRNAQGDAAWRHQLAILRVSEAAAVSALKQAQERFRRTEDEYLPTLNHLQAQYDLLAARKELELLAAAQYAEHQQQIADLRLEHQRQADAARLDHEQRVLREQLAHEQRVLREQLAHEQRVAAAGIAELRRQLDVALIPPPTFREKLQRRAQTVWRRPFEPARRRTVLASDLFDAAWYEAHNEDVRQAKLDPALHYVRRGAAEGRNPGPRFDAAWYVAQHADVQPAVLSHLEHYERHGRRQGWHTMPAEPSTPDQSVSEQSVPEFIDAPIDDTVWNDIPNEPIDERDEPAPQQMLVPVSIEDTDISTEPEEASDAPTEEEHEPPRVLFISGEPHSPGTYYRCDRYAASARRAGWSAEARPVFKTGSRELQGVEVAVLWRVQYNEHVAGVIRYVHDHGGVVVFDVDDLVIRPELARITVIDGIRNSHLRGTGARDMFARTQQTMAACDVCTATTDELVTHMRAFQKASYVLPNGFDAQTHTRARMAVRRRSENTADGLVRIGYASGTLTHQKDFSVALPALLRVLHLRPSVRLVLFRAEGGIDLVEVGEFDSLEQYRDRIEWRDAVPLEQLPDELARFDINIAPLEAGNPFCEAKSELKFFEAALVEVPTVASPTGPFARAMVHGQTGMLAADAAAWEECLIRLIDDPAARRQMGRTAYAACLWRFGPQRRDQLVGDFLAQARGGAEGARAFALGLQNAALQTETISLQPLRYLFRQDAMQQARVTVVVPCYNYAEYVIEALESVRLQTLQALDLVVVDDCSTDPLVSELLLQWMQRHSERFNRALLVRHERNAGLGAARNSGFALAESEYVLPLDADNRLHWNCCEKLLSALDGTRGAFAYPSLKMFGADDLVFGKEAYRPMRFVGGNYIDAMAMVAKWAWSAAGGYDVTGYMGWEDFDLWCKLAERGQYGIWVPEVLADYRVHADSMVASMVELDERKQKMVQIAEQRHNWLRLSSREARERV